MLHQTIYHKYYILDAPHDLTPESASQWPTQKPYKKTLRI